MLVVHRRAPGNDNTRPRGGCDGQAGPNGKPWRKGFPTQPAGVGTLNSDGATRHVKEPRDLHANRPPGDCNSNPVGYRDEHNRAAHSSRAEHDTRSLALHASRPAERLSQPATRTGQQ